MELETTLGSAEAAAEDNRLALVISSFIQDKGRAVNSPFSPGEIPLLSAEISSSRGS
ncbi:MAG: hypothetical protein KY468_11045 [Armatimonadetes bacterium]|nr:hypothetical protein [Armatimonadota bacterium]